MDMPNKITHLVDAIPFLLYIKGKGLQVNGIRIIEVIISTALTVGVIYGIMSTEAKFVREEMAVIKQELKELRRDLYVPRQLVPPK